MVVGREEQHVVRILGHALAATRKSSCCHMEAFVLSYGNPVTEYAEIW